MSGMSPDELQKNLLAPQRAPESAFVIRPRTWGEKKFDTFLHWGLNFGVNSTVSVIYTYIFEHKFPEAWNKCVDGFDKVARGISPVKNMPDKWYGQTGMGLTALSTPGWLFLYPIYKLQHNKRSVVEWLDKVHDKFSAPTPEDLASRPAAYAAIDLETKPTVMGMVKSRVGGLAFNYGIHYAINLTSEKALGGKRVQDYTSIGAGHIAEQYYGNAVRNPDITQTAVQRVLNITGQEIASCFLTAFGMKKILAHLTKGKKEEPIVIAEQAASAPVAAPRDEQVVSDDKPRHSHHASKLAAPAASFTELAARRSEMAHSAQL